MNKLVELLNEYGKENYSDSELVGICIDAYDTEIIISKKFGFIRRLVERDLIDLDKLKDNTSFTMLTHSIGLGCEWRTAHEGESILRVIGTNAIIAYLSIQDEPIEFLISILK